MPKRVKDWSDRCVVCNRVIPVGRLEAMPGVRTCVVHSDEVALTEADVELDGPDGGDLVHLAQASDNRNR